MFGDDDSAVFFNAREFAKTAVFELPGAARSVDGIFDEVAFDPQSGATVIDGVNPVFTCPLDRVRDIPRGTLLNLDGRRWSVKDIDPEGTGLALVHLIRESHDASAGDQD